MACPTVSKFLCCITLETGGLIMGWIYLLISIFFIAYLGTALAITIALYNNIDPLPGNEAIATGLFVFLVIVWSIAILYYLIVFAASVMLIRGTRKRDHTKLMPFMILMVIGIVIYILQIIAAGGAGGVVVSALMLVVVVYFYLCVYSLYNKFRNEKTNPPQMQPYTQTVVYATPYQVQPAAQYGQPAPHAAVYPAAAQSTSEDQPKPTAPV